MTHNDATHHRALVLRVNEIYHDLEGHAYDKIHPEIFEQERDRWQSILSRFMPLIQSGSRTFLDIGSGTGFVGDMLRPHLHQHDTLICSDISAEMLHVCEEKFKSDVFTLKTLKLTTESFDVPDHSVDAILMNSVLHHIPNTEVLLKEIARMLKKDGLLFIGHEPNARFFRHGFLRRQNTFFHHLAPKRFVALILKKLGLYGRLVGPPVADERLTKLNEILMEEKRITEPLTRADVSFYMDIHSPTAGGLYLERGFDAVNVLSTMKEDFDVEMLQTYRYFPKSSNNLWIRKAYEKVLHVFFPSDGATFFLVAKKLR